MRVGVGIYVKNSAAAVELYCRAFNLELGYHVLNADGSFFHSELNRDGVEILDVIEATESHAQNNIVQLSMVLDSEDEVRLAYEQLSVDGVVETPLGPLPWSPYATVIRDHFGVWWYITAPQHYPAEDYDPCAK